jgi:hypothetical protein
MSFFKKILEEVQKEEKKIKEICINPIFYYFFPYFCLIVILLCFLLSSNIYIISKIK